MTRILSALSLADAPERWRALGFAVEENLCAVGALTLRLGEPGRGITGWAVSGLDSELDGLPLIDGVEPRPVAEHPNGAIGVDHVVVGTPDFDRTVNALERAEMPLRRVVTRPDGKRMGFRRLGEAILELVEAPDPGSGPARFWGLVVTVGDLDALGDLLGERLGPIHDAVQPGRRIATLRESAGLGQAFAFMSR